MRGLQGWSEVLALLQAQAIAYISVIEANEAPRTGSRCMFP